MLRLLTLSAGLATHVVLAPSAGAQAAPPPQLAVPALQQDFDVLVRALAEAHGGFDRFAPRADVERRLAAHRARLIRPMTATAFAGVVSEAIAALRDGHARLELDSVTAARLGAARVLPLRVAIEGERLVVRFNDSPSDTLLRPGMEITRIDGRTASSLLATLLPKVSGEGFIETGRRHRLAREFAAMYWLHVAQSERFVVEARDASGRTVTVELPGIPDRDRRAEANPVNAALLANAARLDGPPGTIALQFLGEGTDGGDSVARLRVRSFGGQAFTATLDSAFRVLRERGTTRLVLDLRGNGGGVDEFGAALVAQLVDRPFRYFDRIHLTTIAPSFATWLERTFASLRAGTVPAPGGGFLVTESLHPGVALQQPAATPFLGRLVVLVDGGTFSTAADVAAHLRSMGRGTFVGEETAGTYEGNTSGLNALIVLPNSRLRLKVMMYGYWNAVAPPPRPGRGIVPEHEVPLRMADVLRGADPTLERALTLLR